MLQTYLQPLLTSNKTVITSLSLPASDWIWEKGITDFAEEKKFTFYGVESNPKVHGPAAVKAAQLSKQRKGRATFTLFPQEVDWKKAVTTHKALPEFDIVYPDYMGVWRESAVEETIDTFSSDCLLASKGFLILTIGLTRNRSDWRTDAIEAGEHSNIFVLDDQEDARGSNPGRSQEVVPQAKGIAEQIMGIAEDGGYPLKAYPIHIYYNSTSRAKECLPEASFCFRRTT